MVDSSIVGVHVRRAQEALYCGIKGHTSHFVNQNALNWVVEGLRRLLWTIRVPNGWVVPPSAHLAAVPLEEPYFAVAYVSAPRVHLMLSKGHTTLLVPDENQMLEPHLPSMHVLQCVQAAA